MAEWVARDLEAMASLGRAIAAECTPPRVIGLEGALGVGKTALVRAVLAALGHCDAVPSPTYTLVETYLLDACTVHHLDLYRLSDPEELELLGVRDLATADAIWLVEWPEYGGDRLPPLDHRLVLDFAEGGRSIAGLPEAVVARQNSHQA